MTTWVLLGLLATTPPLVPADAPMAPAPVRSMRVAPRAPAPSLTPEAPARVGFYFAPMSLFGLALSAEVDVALAGGLDLFGSIGGGLAGQLFFEAGLRYYAEGRPMEGFYLDAHASGFALPASSHLLLAPGVQLGHAWRIKSFAISLGAGFSTWWSVAAGTPGTFLFGGATGADVLFFPGLQTPLPGSPAVQPTLRVAIGATL